MLVLLSLIFTRTRNRLRCRKLTSDMPFGVDKFVSGKIFPPVICRFVEDRDEKSLRVREEEREQKRETASVQTNKSDTCIRHLRSPERQTHDD